jgi:hypothetical protein
MANPEISQQRAPLKDRVLAVIDNIRDQGIVHKDQAGSIRIITHNKRLKKIVCLYNRDEQLESRTVTHLPRKFSLADSDSLRD